MSAGAMALPRTPAPPGARVRQALPADRIADPRTDVRARLIAARLPLTRGARVGITAGSRGIGGFVPLLQGIVDAVKELGGEPFVIPSMGSHGGAVAEGQVEILRRLGVTESTVGAPIRATMETVVLGTAANGAAAHLDAHAAKADGVIVLGRVKTHPESVGPLASGLLKMLVIGLGKQHGAAEAHSHGLWDSIRAVGRVTLGSAKMILCGVAVVENGHRHPVRIEVVPPTYDAFLEADLRLLDVAKSHLATVPFDQLDVLVVDELGKNCSGAGMDPNIIGRWRLGSGVKTPDFRRIVVLRLTDPSLGNGLGVGMADFTTQRFLQSYDPAVTYVNLMTASEPGGNTVEGHLPLALPTDRDAIEVALRSALAGPAPRLCRIKNTAELGEMWLSAALLPEAAQNPRLTVLEAAAPMPFDNAGNLF